MFDKIKKRVNDAAKKAATKLTAASEKYSLRQKKIALICFCVLCILFCLFAIVQTFRQKERVHFKITPLHLPARIGKSFSIPEPFISKDVFDQVEYFKNHVDSLTLLNRPGLMDSIALFEKIYFSQSKK